MKKTRITQHLLTSLTGIALFLIYLPFSESAIVYAQTPGIRGSGVVVEATDEQRVLPNPQQFRGWHSLAGKLYQDGVDLQDLKLLYASTLMPKFTSVSFSVNPAESKNYYSGFTSSSKLRMAREFLHLYKESFALAESHFSVPKEYIAAILLVETHFGKNTGSQQIVYRLSRLANISDLKNIERNYQRLRKKDRSVTRKAVADRAQYLEDTFLPEIIAILKIARTNNISPFAMKGSSAGAFGWPQFLPSSYLSYAVDFDRNGRRSLYNPIDAIGSIANYFKQHGWGQKPAYDVIWKYNKSKPYVETVIAIAESLKKP